MRVRRGRRGRGSTPRGQATVEFALVLPVLLIAVLAFAQVVLVAAAQLDAEQLAREIARSVAADPAADVDAIVERLTPTGSNGLDIEVHLDMAATGHYHLVTVSVRSDVSPILEIFEPFSAMFVAETQVTMRSEW